ncbi:MAG TPA: DUF2845 domain-containing protein [Smithellaceae bacterium]|jgi:hypothetical protein|nr:DUF2845 domain-containing protein [Smithellaceae bacterium]
MKKNNIIAILAALIFLLLLPLSSWAFRCGSGLVSEGDSKTKVQVTCGKPTSKETACENAHEYTTTSKSGKTRNVKKCGKKLEVWYYNCGDNDFIYKLTFENGILKDEDTEGRGRGKSDCLGR